MATQEPSRKIRNIKRNKNVTVLIDKTEFPFKGALIYGTAELDYEDVIAKRIAIFERRLSRGGDRNVCKKIVRRVDMRDHSYHTLPYHLV